MEAIKSAGVRICHINDGSVLIESMEGSCVEYYSLPLRMQPLMEAPLLHYTDIKVPFTMGVDKPLQPQNDSYHPGTVLGW